MNYVMYFLAVLCFATGFAGAILLSRELSGKIAFFLFMSSAISGVFFIAMGDVLARLNRIIDLLQKEKPGVK